MVWHNLASIPPPYHRYIKPKTIDITMRHNVNCLGSTKPIISKRQNKATLKIFYISVSVK